MKWAFGISFGLHLLLIVGFVTDFWHIRRSEEPVATQVSLVSAAEFEAAEAKRRQQVPDEEPPSNETPEQQPVQQPEQTTELLTEPEDKPDRDRADSSEIVEAEPDPEPEPEPDPTIEPESEPLEEPAQEQEPVEDSTLEPQQDPQPATDLAKTEQDGPPPAEADTRDNPELTEDSIIVRDEAVKVRAPLPQRKPRRIANLPAPSKEVAPQEAPAASAELEQVELAEQDPLNKPESQVPPEPQDTPELQEVEPQAVAKVEPAPAPLIKPKALAIPKPEPEPAPEPDPIVEPEGAPSPVEPDPAEQGDKLAAILDNLEALEPATPDQQPEPTPAPQPVPQPEQSDPATNLDSLLDRLEQDAPEPAAPVQQAAPDQQDAQPPAQTAPILDQTQSGQSGQPGVGQIAPMSQAGKQAALDALQRQLLTLRAQIDSYWDYPPGLKSSEAPVIPVRIHFTPDGVVTRVESLEPARMADPVYKLWFESVDRAVRRADPLLIPDLVRASQSSLRINAEPRR